MPTGDVKPDDISEGVKIGGGIAAFILSLIGVQKLRKRGREPDGDDDDLTEAVRDLTKRFGRFMQHEFPEAQRELTAQIDDVDRKAANRHEDLAREVRVNALRIREIEDRRS